MKSSKTQLRFTCARMLAIALLALVAVSSAFAQVPTVNPPAGINPATNVGDQGIFLPKGLIRVPVVNAAEPRFWELTANNWSIIGQRTPPAAFAVLTQPSTPLPVQPPER